MGRVVVHSWSVAHCKDLCNMPPGQLMTLHACSPAYAHALVCAGVPPFYGETEAAIFQEVLTGKLDLTSPPWPSISEEAKQLVSHLLVRDPTK